MGDEVKQGGGGQGMRSGGEVRQGGRGQGVRSGRGVGGMG